MKLLEQLTRSSMEDLDDVLYAPALKSFGSFLEYTGGDNPYQFLSFLYEDSALGAENFDLGEFPSWLFISEFTPEIFILYNEDMIKQTAKDNSKWHERYYEMVTLHEIGHARLHLDYLVNALGSTVDSQVWAMPVHETEAWFYAYSVVGLTVSLRARICRLLNQADKQGLV